MVKYFTLLIFLLGFLGNAQETQEETLEAVETTDEDQAEEEAPEVEASEPIEEDPQDGVQKKINKFNREKHDALREAEYWKNVALQKQQAEQQQAPPQPQAPQEPVVEQFNTYEEYVSALTDFKANHAAQQAVYTYQQQQLQAAQQQTIQANIKAAKEKYEDFDSVISNPGVPELSDVLKQAVVTSPEFGDIAYHLGNNPETVTRLNNMSPAQAMFELGSMIHEVRTAPPKKPNAPAPPKILKKGASVIPKSPANMTDSEYREARRKRIKELRR